MAGIWHHCDTGKKARHSRNEVLMFYLGGLTLGYLSPHGPAAPVAAGATLSPQQPVSRKAPRVASGGDDGKDTGTGDRPILWPWHLFC